jgi:hypothetical protein
MKSFRRTVQWLLAALALCTAASAPSRQDLRDALANAPRDLPWTEASIRSKAAFNAGSEKIDPGLLANSTIGIPATSPDALAVGAVDVERQAGIVLLARSNG